MRPIENPQVEHLTNPSQGERYHHPAYAQISALRVSGGRILYGSDFQHDQTVTIRIAKSILDRHLSNDWPHSRDEYIEVALSEAQWATFVSSMNVGSGVQCTLLYKDGKMIPGLPAPQPRRDQFYAEARQTMMDAQTELKDLITMINESKLSAKDKARMISQANLVDRDIGSSIKFVLDQFAEHMHGVVQAAKTEINAYGTHLLVKSGLIKLMGPAAAKKFLGYEDNHE